MYDISKLPGSVRAQILSAGLPMKTIGQEFSDLDPSASLEAVKKWVATVKAGKVIRAVGEPTCGLGLMLVGEPGHGKTTMASVAVQELLRAMTPAEWGTPERPPQRPAMFMDYPKFLRMQKAQWSEDDDVTQEKIDSIYGETSKGLTANVFILDDLGKEYRTSTGWAENTFDALLRSRFNAGLPTIVTTNVPLKNWATVYGEPMGSFAHEAFINLAIIATEGDRRK